MLSSDALRVRSTAQPKAPSREIYFAVSSRAAICSIEQETAPAMPNISHMEKHDMPNTTHSEKQNQVEDFIKRARQYYQKKLRPFLFVQTLLLMGGILIWLLKLPLFLAILCVASVFVVFSFSIRFVVNKFARQMTQEERSMLEDISDITLPSSESEGLLKIKKAYDNVNPQKEYLRAATKTEDGILLRAATYTDTAPQEQLLRAAPTDTTPSLHTATYTNNAPQEQILHVTQNDETP